jgi:membrane complex biogenesis BtpA family protein
MSEVADHQSDKPLVAMIHLPPLPGAGNYDGRPVAALAERAVAEARLLHRAGFSWLLLQNTHDSPSRASAPVVSLTSMAAIGQAVAGAFPGAIGVNVHKNDGSGALAVAHAIGAAFVRVKVLVGAWLGPEGVLQGNADAVSSLRRDLGGGIEVWADLGELTSVPLAPVAQDVLADWAGRFGGADRLIVTEGDVESSAYAVERARQGSPLPVLVGGRTEPGTVAKALAVADGVIVGSCLRHGGRTSGDLSGERVSDYISAARAVGYPAIPESANWRGRR